MKFPWRHRAEGGWRTRSLLAGALVLLLVLGTQWCGRTLQQRRDETVQRLATLPHGLARLSPRERAALGQMRDAPKKYLPAVTRRLALDRDPRRMLAAERQREFLGAVELGFALQDSAALRALQATQESVLALQAAEWRTVRRIERGDPVVMPPYAEFLIRTQRAMLSGWEASGSRLGIPAALQLLAVADAATAMKALQYLATVAPGDTAVAVAAQAAMRSPTAPLGGHPTAEALLGVLSGSGGSKGSRPR